MGKRGIDRISVGLMLLAVQAGLRADSSPIGYWTFDDGAGLTAVDSSGGGHNGTLQSAGGMTWVPGKIRGALSFDGAGWADVPAQVWGTVRNQLTVAFWSFGKEGLPNNWGFFAGNASEQRVVSCHLPWTGSVYFDTTPASGWERINKVAAPSECQGQWHHWTFVKNADTGQKKIYLDGKLWHSGTGFTSAITGITVFRIGAGANHGSPYTGMMDDFQLYNVEITEDQIRSIMQGNVGLAVRPTPKDGQGDVLRDVVLSWTAGDFAATHDVYLGTIFADVNAASRTGPKGVLVGQGRSETSFSAGRLAFGQTYFWRVDEVNAPPDSTIYRGRVWSFTVEPYSYPIAGQAIAATASSVSTPEMSAQKTVDGSGLTGDLHGTAAGDMWLSAMSTEPVWVQYAFDRAYKLDRMLVWNSNQLLEAVLGFGAKAVTVAYSADGASWTALGDFEFARAPGAAGYAANITVDFQGAVARFVKLTIQSNWGGVLPQYGLSEVRFYCVPMAAREPSPASGTTGLDPHVTLSWRAGREAGAHQVFLGTDPNSLSLAATVQTPSYETDVNLDQTCYWRIVEVNEARDPATWAGDVWSFATVKFLVVEDFERYTDDEGQALFQTWLDGLENPANGGSRVGNDPPPYGERTIIHAGRQSMPLFYSNTAGATYSEAQRTFEVPQDWTRHGCRTLALSFYGDPANTGQMYLKINNTKILYSGKAEDLQRTQWQPWNIDLAASGANLKSVTKIALGIDGTGAAGILRVDDIRLYPTAGTTVQPVDPGQTGLVAWYKFDGDCKDSAGTFPGTPKGDAKIVSDPVHGRVLSLDGTGDGVAVPLLGSVNTLTLAMWVNTAVDPVPIQFVSFFHANGWEAKDLHWRFQYGKLYAGISGVTGSLTGTAVPKVNQWNHVAITVSPTEWALWLNGLKEASSPLPAPAEMTLGDGMIGAWLETDGKTISRCFTGTIDDARFYNRALSQEEVGWLAGRTVPFDKPF